HGVFAQALLDGLSGKADGDSDGVVTVQELRRHVLKETARLSRLHGKSAREKTSRAFGWGGRETDYPLAPNPKAAPLARKRLEKLEELAKAGRLTAFLAAEGRSLLSLMPAAKHRQEMRGLWVKLADGDSTLDDFKAKRLALLRARLMSAADADRFAARIIEATRAIRDDYVRETSQSQLVAWAVRGLYWDAEAKLLARFEEKLRQGAALDEKALRDLLAQARRALGRRDDLDEGRDVALALRRMLGKLDPQSAFTDAEALKRRSDDGTGAFTGIGINYKMDPFTEEAFVSSPIKGSPAHKAGLVADDLVTHIDGKPTKGLATDDVRKLVLGAAGSKVKLTIRREGEKRPLEVELTRGRVEPETVLGVKRKASADWDFMIDARNRIGYIRMPSFGRATMKELRDAAKALEGQGMKALVLDLRGNLGGLLNVSVEVGGLFVGDAVVASLKPRVGKGSVFRGKKEGALLGFPMACLVDRNTAAGGEMVAAALQDHGRARLFGERTWGLASVRSVKDVDGELKGQFLMTTSYFYRPNGKNLNKSATAGKQDEAWGVVPDQAVTMARSERTRLGDHQAAMARIEGAAARAKPNRPDIKDRQLDAALDWLRGQVKGR
ncbi:MAG: S41 family peptidase, partial [Gemmataceae bacterium]|nr:S41 family peptidase [Gemmataceae bacterium]